ncbi:hypothetical protein KC19_10G157600 [Ceratodon purpureus]|uniref:SURP motif domain-containing protein n=1 Tax=Ceratodon purpureus TaxID=3225 RepID=A0A8T0GMF0_CERPU|nr:hypothetical protein KC19_10G157600 [Ceratodon purpureus]
MGHDDEGVRAYYGTPLVSEEELNPRKRKAALDQGQARRVAPWNQEVTDSEGRRRFHGAFTGGFSAGHFNTVGSKEGWTPQSFTSSRQARAADKKAQAAYDFMDEDEKAEFEAKNMQVRPEFDTFGSTAAEYERRQALKEIGDRPSAIPGPLIDEIIIPVNDSTGVKLLRLMGWRGGRQIGPKHVAAASGARREARKAMMSLAQNNSTNTVSSGPEEIQGRCDELILGDEEDFDADVPKITPAFVMNPKKDLYGLGFDPFKDAPEFRERKRALEEDRSGDGGWRGHALSLKRPSLFRPNAGKIGGGFGIGALEDLGDEDEDVYDQGMEFEVQELEEDEKPVEKLQKRLLEDPLHKGSTLTGFHISKEPPKKKLWLPPPIIPENFNFIHKFDKPLGSERLQERPPPPAAQPPDDPELCKYIEGLASFVAKSGPRFEEISKEKQRENPMFAFLFGGLGHDYYKRRLWEEEEKLVKEGKQHIRIDHVESEKAGRQSKFSPKVGADERGKMLGEIPLPKGVAPVQRQNTPVASAVRADDRARLQSALSSTFTSTSPQVGETAKNSQPFKNDSAKQNRFEQFLKGKSVGGLWKPTSGGSGLSEAERSEEIFEFEAIARMQQQGLALENRTPLNVQGKPVPELVAIMGSRFAAAGVETKTTMAEAAVGTELVLRGEVKQYPRREENPWRPASMLCKRFDLLDPFAGKPPPLPKPRSRTESFILLTNPVESKLEYRPPPSHAPAIQKSATEGPKTSDSNHKRDEGPVMFEEKIEPIPERPVDLYKALFADDTDDEDEETRPSQASAQAGPSAGDPMNRAEAANAVLNRLVAGDFLESLGKELGLKVPEPVQPAGDRPAAKELDGIGLGRSKNDFENKGTEFRRQSGGLVGAVRDQHGFFSRHERSGRQSQIKGSVAENLYSGRESQYTALREKQLQPDKIDALLGVKTRQIDVPDNPGRWADDSSIARPRAIDKEAKVAAAPSTATRYGDTEPESDSDKEKALAKRIRREERRLQREKEKEKHKHRKEKHKHRKDHSHEKSSRKKARV